MDRLDGIIDTWKNEEKVLPEDVEWMIKEIERSRKVWHELQEKIAQKDKEIERLTKSNKGLGQGLREAGVEIERLKKKLEETEEELYRFNWGKRE